MLTKVSQCPRPPYQFLIWITSGCSIAALTVRPIWSGRTSMTALRSKRQLTRHITMRRTGRVGWSIYRSAPSRGRYDKISNPKRQMVNPPASKLFNARLRRMTQGPLCHWKTETRRCAPCAPRVGSHYSKPVFKYIISSGIELRSCQARWSR